MTTIRWGLAAGVPILDVERDGRPVAADVVTVSLFGEGRDSAGQPSYAARVVTLHGAEFLNFTPVAPDPTAIRDLEPLGVATVILTLTLRKGDVFVMLTHLLPSSSSSLRLWRSACG